MRQVIGQSIWILLLGVSSLFSACDKNVFCEQGSSTVVTKTLSLTALESVDLGIAGEVNIMEGATQSIEVTGPSNVVDKIRTSVSNKHWNIEFESGCYNYNNLTINITIPKLTAANIAGSGNITVHNFTNQGNLDVGISGSGNLNLNQFSGTENLKISIQGSGNVNASANFPDIKAVDAAISGSGSINIYPILAQTSTATITGSGNCYVYASNDLNATISGSGSISYKGMPNIVSSITGSGTLINAN